MTSIRLWTYLLGLSALWGSAFPLVRLAVQSMPPLALSSARGHRGRGAGASAVPLTLYLHLLKTAPAADAALISYLQPVWATLLAALLLGEVPGPRVMAGGAVVLAGVWLASGGGRVALTREGRRTR